MVVKALHRNAVHARQGVILGYLREIGETAGREHGSSGFPLFPGQAVAGSPPTGPVRDIDEPQVHQYRRNNQDKYCAGSSLAFHFSGLIFLNFIYSLFVTSKYDSIRGE